MNPSFNICILCHNKRLLIRKRGSSAFKFDFKSTQERSEVQKELDAINVNHFCTFGTGAHEKASLYECHYWAKDVIFSSRQGVFGMFFSASTRWNDGNTMRKKVGFDD